MGSRVTSGIHTVTAGLNCQSGPLTDSLHANGARVLNFVDRRITAAPCTNNVVLNTRATTDRFNCVLVAIVASNRGDRDRRVTTLGQCNASNFLCTGVSGHVARIPSSLTGAPLILISTASSLNGVPDIRPGRFQVNCSTAAELIGTKYAHVTCINYSRPVVTRSNHLRNCRTTLESTNLSCSSRLIIGILGDKPTLATIDSLFSTRRPSKFFYFGSTHT